MLPETIGGKTALFIYHLPPVWLFFATILHMVAKKQLFPWHMVDAGWYKFLLVLTWLHAILFLSIFALPAAEYLFTGSVTTFVFSKFEHTVFPITYYASGVWCTAALINWVFYTLNLWWYEKEAPAPLPIPEPVNTQPLQPEPMPEPVKVTIPYNLRTQHMHVVASTGHGKSQLFQSLILDDLERDQAVVVIDSQNDLINNLATRVPRDRIILIDPEHCPPAINPFAFGASDEFSTLLLEYMFNSKDAPLTSKQSMCFRMLGQYVIQQKEGIRELVGYLTNPETVRLDAVETLGIARRNFLELYLQPKGQFGETRQEILRRVLTILENPTIERMFTSGHRLNIAPEIEAGKVILISTAKAFLGNDGATLFGRMFMAQMLQTIMRGSRNRVHMYLDEFQDYAEDSSIMQALFTQSRKYNLGMVCAHQSLSQLPDGLKASMATNCAIKLVGGASAEDRNAFAKQMDIDQAYVGRGKKGTFTAWFRDQGVHDYTVEFGRLERQPEIGNISLIRERMREKYGPLPEEQKPTTNAPATKSFIVDD